MSLRRATAASYLWRMTSIQRTFWFYIATVRRDARATSRCGGGGHGVPQHATSYWIGMPRRKRGPHGTKREDGRWAHRAVNRGAIGHRRTELSLQDVRVHAPVAVVAQTRAADQVPAPPGAARKFLNRIVQCCKKMTLPDFPVECGCFRNGRHMTRQKPKPYIKMTIHF